MSCTSQPEQSTTARTPSARWSGQAAGEETPKSRSTPALLTGAAMGSAVWRDCIGPAPDAWGAARVARRGEAFQKGVLQQPLASFWRETKDPEGVKQDSPGREPWVQGPDC